MKKQYVKILESYYCGSLLLIGAKHAHLMQRFDGLFQPSGLTYRHLACISYAVSPWVSPVQYSCKLSSTVISFLISLGILYLCPSFVLYFSAWLGDTGNYPFQMYWYVCTSSKENKWDSFHDSYHYPQKLTSNLTPSGKWHHYWCFISSSTSLSDFPGPECGWPLNNTFAIKDFENLY